MSADGLYGNAEFIDKASNIFGGVQVVTKIRAGQSILFRGKRLSVKEYFKSSHLVIQKVDIRCNGEVELFINSARLIVESHGVKRFITAVRCPEEKEPRYPAASDLSWWTQDIR